MSEEFTDSAPTTDESQPEETSTATTEEPEAPAAEPEPTPTTEEPAEPAPEPTETTAAASTSDPLDMSSVQQAVEDVEKGQPLTGEEATMEKAAETAAESAVEKELKSEVWRGVTVWMECIYFRL